jgi:Domain of Unknown Function with PDB structure (DUF3861)
MKGHLHRVTVQYLEDNKCNPVGAEKLVFETRNHDELMQIVGRTRARGQFQGDEAAAFAIGLKSFGEVMLQHRNSERFREFAPHFKEFMGRPKGGNKA